MAPGSRFSVRRNAAAMALALIAPLCHAQTTAGVRHPYHLPRGPLDALLLQLAADNGIALAYDPHLLAAVQGGPVDGLLAPMEALARALDGTGLVLAERAGAQGWTIHRGAAPGARPAVTRPAPRP